MKDILFSFHNFLKKIFLFFTILSIFSLFSCTFSERSNIHISSRDTSWKWENGIIVTESPLPPTDQNDVLQLQTEKLDVVRIGFVGLGTRGRGAINRYVQIPGVEIKGLCDHEKERTERCQQILKNNSMPPASLYDGEEGYKALCERNDVDLIYIATDWKHHFPVAIYALEHGKHVAIEVPSAMNLKECWALVDMSEKNRRHCMILENCCYDWFEMNTLNMVQQGLFGEIIYAQGAYIHDLSKIWNRYWKENENDLLGWRLDYNMKHRGDLYPTHGLGPIAQVMNIHRGDRMKTLIAMDTESFIGKKLVKERTGKTCSEFRNGDHTVTLIRTEQGKVINIQHNVMTPQPYSRSYQLTGTKGMAIKYPIQGYALDTVPQSSVEDLAYDNLNAHQFLSTENMNKLIKKYNHPILKKYGDKALKVGGHGGMDFIMDSRLIYCLQHGLPLDMDVYDLAEWCCLAELGELSMDNHGAPVAIPDFTRGKWNHIKGYSHAFASPEEEKEVEERSLIFTKQLKEKGKKIWSSQ